MKPTRGGPSEYDKKPRPDPFKKPGGPQDPEGTFRCPHPDPPKKEVIWGEPDMSEKPFYSSLSTIK